MKYRAYFKIKFTALSPLSIGDSVSVQTDRDAVLDSRGMPVIPATAVAGVIRSRLSPEERDRYFGFIAGMAGGKGGSEREQKGSELAFYDAELAAGPDGAPVSVRDSVALDKYKTAVKGAKFDFQIVEPGAVFVGCAAAETAAAARKLEELLASGILYFGSKTTRGYGKVKAEYRLKEFALEDDGKSVNKECMEEWLDFDMFDWEEEGPWLPEASALPEGKTFITLSLRQNGSGLSIRQYYIDEGDAPKKDSGDKGADYGPVSLLDGTPVIPGTSWAGMFRRRVGEFLKDDASLKEAFGYVGGKEDPGKTVKSKISFGESRLLDCSEKQLTRNAIDRFTNGTKQGALYTEDTVYGGHTELEIAIEESVGTAVREALCAAIMDVHYGYAAVGGLTAVGRGLFRIEGISVNRKPLDSVDFAGLKQEVCNA